jgi:Fungal protein kinase
MINGLMGNSAHWNQIRHQKTLTNFVKLFAAFAFADKKSLGFDPTIQRAKNDHKQFIITVHPANAKNNPRTFRTKSIISSYGAEPLRG